MDDLSKLFRSVDPPYFGLVADQASNVYGQTIQWSEDGCAVRVMRGSKMQMLQGVFDETAAALQFPPYFGENWAALDECIADLEWLPAGSGYVLVITNAGDVLTGDHDQLPVFVRILNKAASEWAVPVELGEEWDRPAVPFTVVLQADPDTAASVQARWEDAGAEFAVS